MANLARLHAVNRAHLNALTGELGIFRHAIGKTPDPAQGHGVDDIARALQVDLLHARTLGWPAVAESADRGLTFLESAFDPASGKFGNDRAADGTWLDGTGSGEGLGRAILALGEIVAAAPDKAIVDRAAALLETALPATTRVTSSRTQSLIILGCAAVARATTTHEPGTPRRVLLTQATELMRRFATGLHAKFLWSAGPGWLWLEPSLTTEHAVIPRALIVAGRQLGADAMLAIGLQVTDWLFALQTAPAGHLSPIGNGPWTRLGERTEYDQQPIEVTTLLLAAEAAWQATGADRYAAAMERAYGWFLGQNDGGRRLASPASGACHDGLTRDGINANQGAEATLMWLMALEHIRAARERTAKARAATPEPISVVTGPRQRTQRALPEGRSELLAG